MSKKYIPNALLVNVEQFRTADLPLPFIEESAQSPTGYFIKSTRKTYIEEKPPDIPETMEFKTPIANNDYYVKETDSLGDKYTVYQKSVIDNFFTEI